MADPFNLEAERAVLGAVLLHQPTLDTLAPLLRMDDFYSPVHRAIWEAYLQIRARAGAIDIVTVEAELGDLAQRMEGGPGYLVRLAEACPTHTNARHYAGIVKDRAIRRRLGLLCVEVGARSKDEDTPLEVILAEAQREIFRVTTDGRAARAQAVGELLPETMATIEAKELGTAYGFPTGLETLDAILGHLQPENLIIVGGRPGSGKSAFAANVALRGGLAGLPSLGLSLEMSRQEVVERWLAYFSGVPVERIHAARPRNRLTGPEWVKLTQAEHRLAPLPLSLLVERMELGDLLTEARRWRAEHPDGPCLVWVDYLQLVDVRGERGETRDRALTRCTSALKLLAKEIRGAVMLLSALNRAPAKEKRRPQLEDLRETGGGDGDADQVVLIHSGGELADDVAELGLVKNRHGRKGMVLAKWDGPCNVFSDREGPQTEIQGA